MKMQISFAHNGIEYRSAFLLCGEGQSLEDAVDFVRERMIGIAALSLEMEDGSFVIITEGILSSTLFHCRGILEVAP